LANTDRHQSTLSLTRQASREIGVCPCLFPCLFPGIVPQAGEVLLVARYAGGPREDAVSYRIDALCDSTGKSLLQDGGRLPEACEV